MRTAMRRVLAACAAGFTAIAGHPVEAHELGNLRALVTFDEHRYDIDILVDPQALLAQLALERGEAADSIERVEGLAARLQEASPRILQGIEILFDQRPAEAQIEYRQKWPAALGAGLTETGPLHVGSLHVSGLLPPGTESFVFSYRWTYGAMALLVRDARQDQVQTLWMGRGERSATILVRNLVAPSGPATVREYVGLGFTHILPKGLDHILFVLGLFFLSAGFRSLLLQVSTFTAAHTLTLGLSSVGIFTLDPAIVEPLIALSIAYVALENLTTTTLRRSRLALIFGFGLLHGLGFAGVLSELGFPAARFATALLSFNIGVEFGQLTVIGLAMLAVAGWRRHEASLMPLVARPASVVIALGGLYWTVERVAGW